MATNMLNRAILNRVKDDVKVLDELFESYGTDDLGYHEECEVDDAIERLFQTMAQLMSYKQMVMDAREYMED